MCRCVLPLPLQKGVKKGPILDPLRLDPGSGPRDPDLDQIWTHFGPPETPEKQLILGVLHVAAHV